jgi:hypothetical protein
MIVEVWHRIEPGDQGSRLVGVALCGRDASYLAPPRVDHRTFETAIIERCQRRETLVEEA